MKRTKFTQILAILLTMLFSNLYSYGWDEVGHKLTAYVAWQQMTPEVREKVFAILIEAPENSDLSVIYNAFNSRSDATKKLEFFMFASVWSDNIRNRKFTVRNKTYSRDNWHYSDIFWTQNGADATILRDFSGAGGVAIPKLYEWEKILRSPKLPAAAKAVALAWFLHVTGDIHNPLHNASRVTKSEPKGDRGGNQVTLRKADKSTGIRRKNLHGFWDSIIGNIRPRKNDACDLDYLAPIARKMIKRHKFSKLSQRLFLGNYKKWSMEGFEMLPRFVYIPEIVRNEMPSKKYKKMAYGIAEEQITLAGYRIGATLNQIFASPKK